MKLFTALVGMVVLAGSVLASRDQPIEIERLGAGDALELCRQVGVRDFLAPEVLKDGMSLPPYSPASEARSNKQQGMRSRRVQDIGQCATSGEKRGLRDITRNDVKSVHDPSIPRPQNACGNSQAALLRRDKWH